MQTNGIRVCFEQDLEHLKLMYVFVVRTSRPPTASHVKTGLKLDDTTEENTMQRWPHPA